MKGLECYVTCIIFVLSMCGYSTNMRGLDWEGKHSLLMQPDGQSKSQGQPTGNAVSATAIFSGVAGFTP